MTIFRSKDPLETRNRLVLSISRVQRACARAGLALASLADCDALVQRLDTLEGELADAVRSYARAKRAVEASP